MTKMHLLWFCAFSPHAGFGLDGWAGPRTGSGYDWTRPELWQDMAVALERAKFDLILLGDSLAVPGTYQGRMDAYLRYAEHAPFHDPSPLVAIMAAATRRIGLAATLSTTFYPPFLLARLMTTLDHLSRGRIAWNVVTSYKREEALNFGYQELLDHDQRYDRADEYLELCAQLWASWEPDAVVMDPRTNTFADPAKVRTRAPTTSRAGHSMPRRRRSGARSFSRPARRSAGRHLRPVTPKPSLSAARRPRR
jgi:alkanesulfonate monooxygenase SsuD/methylene tetrahydromethanopterin reductase-like flavin-dependent oxidoreductase (luciferase family)